MLLNAWNWFWNLATTVQSIAFGLAAVLTLLGLAWGKNGAKKLGKAREAKVFSLAGWSAVVYLGLLAFTIGVQLINYIIHLFPSRP